MNEQDCQQGRGRYPIRRQLRDRQDTGDCVPCGSHSCNGVCEGGKRDVSGEKLRGERPWRSRSALIRSSFSTDEEVCASRTTAVTSRSFCRQRKPDSHKGSYGKVLMITGSSGMAGAAYLSAKAAYAVGPAWCRFTRRKRTGLSCSSFCRRQLSPAITNTTRRSLSALLDWADVVCIGCGLGTGETSARLLEGTLSRVNVPCIIDADGLNLLSRNMHLLEKIQSPVVLTPHMKEMSRLTGYSVSEISDRRLEIISEFTKKYPTVCVLKDSRTVVL